MSIILSFAPFIAFTAFSSWVDWRAGIVAGLVALIIVTLRSPSRRLGVLGAGQLVFFLVAGAYAVVQPDSGVQDQLNTIGMAWLVIVAVASIAFRHPFTLDYSTDDVSPEIAATPLFMRINRNIAWVWAAWLGISAAVQYVAIQTDRSAIGNIVSVALLVGAVKFTASYPDRAVAEAMSAPSADHALPNR